MGEKVVEVHTYGQWRAYLIEGTPYPLGVAARILGLTKFTLQKRVERRGDLSKRQGRYQRELRYDV